jgi:hypothetical protein
VIKNDRVKKSRTQKKCVKGWKEALLSGCVVRINNCEYESVRIVAEFNPSAQILNKESE